MSEEILLDKKKFITGISISLLIVFVIESFRLILVADGNGGRFLALNMERLRNMDGSKSGVAIVLQPHTIKTEWGDIKLRLFATINRYHGVFSAAEKGYKHNLTFFGQPITGNNEVYVRFGDRLYLGVKMYEYKRQKFQFYGQDIIPASMAINYSLDLNNDGEYEEYHRGGVRFYTTYTDTDTSPIKLKDGSIIYAEIRYAILAPEDGDWTIAMRGDNYVREKYIQFPNGKRLNCEKVIIEPYWGKAKEVTTLEGEVLTYPELVEKGYFDPVVSQSP